MRIGELLKLYRLWESFNLRDFASELEISAATLSRIERGEAMDGKTLAKVLRWLLKEAN